MKIAQQDPLDQYNYYWEKCTSQRRVIKKMSK